MKPTGFYKLDQSYIDLIAKLNGTYRDNKERPIYCCIQDKDHPQIYWAIPTSDLAHRTPAQVDRIQSLCALPERDIRSCYYHIGHTNRPAIFKISNALPVTEKYIAGEYISQGMHLILRDRELIGTVEKKLHRILLTEQKNPNKFEQHITDIKAFLIVELEKSQSLKSSIVEKLVKASKTPIKKTTEFER